MTKCDFSVVGTGHSNYKEKKQSIDARSASRSLKSVLLLIFWRLNRLFSSCIFLFRCLFRRFVPKQENKLLGSPRSHTVSEMLPL